MNKRIRILFTISNFKDYNNCVVDFESNFYVRRFKDHLKENCFLEKPHGHDFYLILIIRNKLKFNNAISKHFTLNSQ